MVLVLPRNPGKARRVVGWVEREIPSTRTRLSSARNPCGTVVRLFSLLAEKQSAHGRMGFARSAAAFLLKNSRAAPILRLPGRPWRWSCHPRNPGKAGRVVGWVEREILSTRTPFSSARNPCGAAVRLFSPLAEKQSAHGRMGSARSAAAFLLKNSRAAPILRLPGLTLRRSAGRSARRWAGIPAAVRRRCRWRCAGCRCGRACLSRPGRSGD
ncbi:Uncharacterised protein [Achromobacter denitrificans]|nr:hypothetical protein LMG1231_01498 [Achromobacter denitrificans]SUU04966.1 Uncharacterised protein [Achromobacter denitrificans]